MRTLFEVLGVEPRYHLAADELERKYKALSQKLHPDRFARAPASERVRALQQSTELNDAYRVLKVPARRGEYLLKLAGLDITEEGGSQRVKIDPELLMELLEEREALSEAKARGDHETITTMQQAATARRAAGLQAIDALFTRYESGDQTVVMDLAQKLIELRYAEKFLSEVEAIFESAGHA
jgi:molecular chaperone HscB